MKLFTLFYLFSNFFILNGLQEYKVTSVDENFKRLDDIVNVINSAYKRVPYIKDDTTRTNLEDVTSIIKSSNKKLYICIHRNNICGTFMLTNKQDKLEMGLFAVDPKYQGKGIGALLMQYAQEEAKKLNKNYLYIKVIPLYQGKLIAYYERNGFMFTGEQECFSEETLKIKIKPENWSEIYIRIMRKKIN